MDQKRERKIDLETLSKMPVEKLMARIKDRQVKLQNKKSRYEQKQREDAEALKRYREFADKEQSAIKSILDERKKGKDSKGNLPQGNVSSQKKAS